MDKLLLRKLYIKTEKIFTSMDNAKSRLQIELSEIQAVILSPNTTTSCQPFGKRITQNF